MHNKGFFDQSFLKTKFVAATIVAWYANMFGQDLATVLERNNILLYQGDTLYALQTIRKNTDPLPTYSLLEIQNDKLSSYIFDPNGTLTRTEGYVLYDQNKNVSSLHLTGEPTTIRLRIKPINMHII